MSHSGPLGPGASGSASSTASARSCPRTSWARAWRIAWSSTSASPSAAAAAASRRFYLLRASVNASLGAHDEWNLWVLLNRRRLARASGHTGVLMPGYFDGRQVDPGASLVLTSNGYGRVTG